MTFDAQNCRRPHCAMKGHEMIEMYRIIPDFPAYEVSNLGNVRNRDTGRLLTQSHTIQRDRKITLYSSDSDEVKTKSVRVLVAEAFVPRPDESCNTVVILNLDKEDLRATNLRWRPRSIAWNYVRQFEAPEYNTEWNYTRVPVFDYETGERYENILEAAVTHGLLMSTIWSKAAKASMLEEHRRDLTPVWPTNITFVFEGGLR